VVADEIRHDVAADVTQPVLICLLGSFRVLKVGANVPVRSGGKTAILLSSLALRDRHRASRQSLLETLWPDTDSARSAHALNSLIYALRQLLGDALAGAPPVVYTAGAYELNEGAGVGVDVAHFDTSATTAERHLREGDIPAAVRSWCRAAAIYKGDVYAVGEDIHAIVQRERLRGLYLSVLAHLADQCFRESNYSEALGYALRLLSHDPCREDGHRMAMRCYVRLGERAQALRQYRLCAKILASEFDAQPEALTGVLFEQVRTNPGAV